MVLVDINSVKQQGNGDVEIKNNEAITKAISSLANSAVSVSRINKEIGEILEREDLDPREKLKLYSQGLNRFLFLQRQSDKNNNTLPSYSEALSSEAGSDTDSEIASISSPSQSFSSTVDPVAFSTPVPVVVKTQSSSVVRGGKGNSLIREII